MNTNGYDNRDIYLHLPNVPMEELREYVRVLCQIHAIKEMVSPGHDWFDLYMKRLRSAAGMFKEKYVQGGVDKRAARHLAKVEAIRWLDDTNAGERVRMAVLRSLEQGLPEVDDARLV